jgi:uncharacterized membrane protein
MNDGSTMTKDERATVLAVGATIAGFLSMLAVSYVNPSVMNREATGHFITYFLALVLFGLTLVLFVVALGFAVKLLFSKNARRGRLGRFLMIVALMMIPFVADSLYRSILTRKHSMLRKEHPNEAVRAKASTVAEP